MTKLKETIARLQESLACLTKNCLFRASEWNIGYCTGVLAARARFDEHKQALLDAAEEVEKLGADKERLDWLQSYVIRGSAHQFITKLEAESPLDSLREAIDAARSLQTHGRVPESTAEAKQEASPARKEKAE